MIDFQGVAFSCILLAVGGGSAWAQSSEFYRADGEREFGRVVPVAKELRLKAPDGPRANRIDQRPIIFQSTMVASSQGPGSVGPGPQEGPVGYPGRPYSANAICRGQAGTYSVCLDLEVLEAVGHNHFEGRPGVEIIGERCKENLPVNVQAQWDFEAPQFASRLRASWFYRGECIGEPSAQGGFGVPNLVELTAGTGYEIRKGAPMHRFNTFGAAVTVTLFKAIAAEYRADFPTAGNMVVLGVSLPWGGLYDIDSSWAPPYSDHRFGFELDLAADSVPIANRFRLREIAKSRQVWIDESDGLLILKFPPFSPDR